ncbi:MAG: hypothetical protein WD396_12120, partial [Pseudohongiellaceae bacterium]
SLRARFQAPVSIGFLGVFASWREQKIDPEKINPKNVLSHRYFSLYIIQLTPSPSETSTHRFFGGAFFI